MVTIWMRERGSGTMVFAPAEPSVLRTSSPQTVPTIFGVWSVSISTTVPCAEGAARVLLVRRALPLPGVECPARVVGDELPWPDVDVVVPAVVLPERDRLGHLVALVRRPVRIGAVVGQHRHSVTVHRAVDVGLVQ